MWHLLVVYLVSSVFSAEASCPCTPCTCFCVSTNATVSKAQLLEYRSLYAQARSEGGLSCDTDSACFRFTDTGTADLLLVSMITLSNKTVVKTADIITPYDYGVFGQIGPSFNAKIFTLGTACDGKDTVVIVYRCHLDKCVTDRSQAEVVINSVSPDADPKCVDQAIQIALQSFPGHYPRLPRTSRRPCGPLSTTH